MFTQHEAEGKRLKNPFDTITEGIGINRQTANFGLAQIDGAFKGTDQEAVEMVSQIACHPLFTLANIPRRQSLGCLLEAKQHPSPLTELNQL